jgi:hypothetical protein
MICVKLQKQADKGISKDVQNLGVSPKKISHKNVKKIKTT